VKSLELLSPAACVLLEGEDESNVGADGLTLRLHVVESIIQGVVMDAHEVRDDNSGRAADALTAVDEDLTVVEPHVFDERETLFKVAANVFIAVIAYVYFQEFEEGCRDAGLMVRLRRVL